MLDVHLREHTRLAHAALEKKMLSKINRIENQDQYLDLLAILYGYYHAIEVSLQSWFADKDEFLRRRKASRLLDDMRCLNTENELPQLCTLLPAVDCYHKALGVMYVLEGSTLGGQTIARRIETRLKTTDGMSFFLSYGKDVESMWLSFKTMLRQPFTDEEKKMILSGATETFLTFEHWLSAHD